MLQAKRTETRGLLPTAQRAMREITTFRWQPNRSTAVALGSYVLVVLGLFVAFQVFTTTQVAANFITFGPVTLVGLGVALPAVYTTLKLRRPLSDLGLSRRYLLPSLALGLLLGLDTYRNTLATLNVSWTMALAPLVTMALAVGLFEAIFFRGWLQLRLEASFGILPAIALGAACYSLYHVGYGMSADEMLVLFGLGLLFATAFRLTKNIAVLWPLYTPVGGLYTNLREGLSMPFEATYGFVLTLAMMSVVIALAMTLGRRATARAPQPEARLAA